MDIALETDWKTISIQGFSTFINYKKNRETASISRWFTVPPPHTHEISHSLNIKKIRDSAYYNL